MQKHETMSPSKAGCIKNVSNTIWYQRISRISSRRRNRFASDTVECYSSGLLGRFMASTTFSNSRCECNIMSGRKDVIVGRN